MLKIKLLFIAIIIGVTKLLLIQFGSELRNKVIILIGAAISTLILEIMIRRLSISRSIKS